MIRECCLVFAFGFVLVGMCAYQQRVVITGAGGSVGLELFKKLLDKKNFYPVGLVRSQTSYDRLIKAGARPDQIKRGDITKRDSLKGLCDGATKLVTCTSAVSKLRTSFRLRSLFGRLLNQQATPTGSDYYFRESPYDVDWLGQRNVIDEAVGAGVEHIVMVQNMGGYRKASRLNEVGRRIGELDPKVGNILKWKRKSERYLMKRCFFTIVHAGTLIDDPGGLREIVFDNDDALLRSSFTSIPKAGKRLGGFISKRPHVN
jgi:NAD(P)H-binding